MIYPEDLELKLGFDQIRQKITLYCLSPQGIRLVNEIKFSQDFKWITTSLQQNLEFRQILEKAEDFPSKNFFDPTGWFQKIILEGSYLDEREFLEMAYAIQTIVACKTFLQRSKETYPELFRLTESVSLSQQLAQLILSKVDENATVKDSASPELGRIRKHLREERSRLRKLTDQIFRNAVAEKWVPEGALPTVREGRLVIPILAEHKRRLKGFILDESATGQTVFMEPAEMLDTNNGIRDLEHAEKREVIRILKELTSSLRSHLLELEQAFDFLAQIDFIRAKAKLSVEINAELQIGRAHV